MRLFQVSLCSLLLLAPYCINGRALRATVTTGSTRNEAGCNGQTDGCVTSITPIPALSPAENPATADLSAYANGDGAFAKTEISRTVIGGGTTTTPQDVATSTVAANAVNPINTAGTAATRGYVSSAVNDTTDQASAAVTGQATSNPQGNATVVIGAVATALKDKNVGTANLYLGASGTGRAGVPNTAYGKVLVNADSKGAAVSIPVAKVYGQTLRMVGNETTSVGSSTAGKVQTYNNITSKSTGTGPGFIELRDATTKATNTTGESKMPIFQQNQSGLGSATTNVAQGNTYKFNAAVKAKAYNKLLLNSGSKNDSGLSMFNQSFINLNSQVAANPRLAQASIDEFRADARDDGKFAYANVRGEATSGSQLEGGLTKATSTVKFRAYDGKVTTDADRGLAWRVHGSGYTYTVAKNAKDGSPQAFSIGTVLGGNPREKTGGSNPTAGSWVDVSRAAYLQGRPYCKSSTCADQKNAYAFGSQKNSVLVNGVTTTVSFSDTNEADDWFRANETGIVGLQDTTYNKGRTFGPIDVLTKHGTTRFYVNKCPSGECPRALVPPVQGPYNKSYVPRSVVPITG